MACSLRGTLYCLGHELNQVLGDDLARSFSDRFTNGRLLGFSLDGCFGRFDLRSSIDHHIPD